MTLEPNPFQEVPIELTFTTPEDSVRGDEFLFNIFATDFGKICENNKCTVGIRENIECLTQSECLTNQFCINNKCIDEVPCEDFEQNCVSFESGIFDSDNFVCNYEISKVDSPECNGEISLFNRLIEIIREFFRNLLKK